MAKNDVEFKDTSAEAKAGLLKQQYIAMKAATSEALKIVRERAPKRKKKKRLVYNIQARTYTRTKFGFVVAHVGVLDKAHSKKVPYAGFYAHDLEFGTSDSSAQPYLKPGVMEAIPIIRAKLAEYLPNIENGNPNAPDMDETTDE
jgi:HK97 gp10 family phage protein